jgi:glycosyltransferase involved in cell wall biosynthesis
MKKKISFISQPEYFRFIYENDLNDIFEVQEFPFNFDAKIDDFEKLVEFNADCNIFFRGEFFPNEILKKIKGKKIALSSEPFPRKINGKWEYTLDSLKRYFNFRKIRNKNFDYIFHYDISSKELFEKDGILISGEFTFPVATETYKKSTDNNKKWDIFFIGRSTKHREDLFGPLKHKFNFLHIAHGVWGPELVEYINKSKICINAHAEEEISWEPRMQMLLSSGAFVLSEKITPNPYLKPGTDYVEFSGKYDLIEKFEYYLNRKNEREKITENAQKKIINTFDAKKRFYQLFNDLDSGKIKKTSFKKGLLFFELILFFHKYLKLILRKIGLFRLIELISNTKKELKRNGFFGLIRRLSVFLGFNYPSFGISKKINKIKRYLFPRKKVYGKKTRMAYVIPGVKISGGVAIILQHANRLKKLGYDVKIITFSKETKIDWFENHVPIFSIIKNNKEKLFSDIDTLIATHWSTAFFVNFANVGRRIYFVQSDERRFNPDNKSEIKSITETYQLDMEFMTEAKWIQSWLKNEFNKDAYYVPNGLDENIFHKESLNYLAERKKTRVLIEGPIDFWFKGMDKAYNAIKDLECEIWIISSHGKPKKDWRYDKFFENVPIEKMKDIYSSCDIFLKMSYMEGFFGPPMEAMACGCAVVVGKVTGYDEYIKNEHNALVVEQGDVEGAKKVVQRLIDDKALREKLIENGYKTSREWSWDKSIKLLEKVISGDEIEKYYTDKYPEKYNYSEEIGRLLEARKKLR